MNEKDCVLLYVDLLKWGLVILFGIIAWMIGGSNRLDWNPVTPLGKIPVRLVFLLVTGAFWLIWAEMLARIRRRAIAASPEGQDFLKEIGLSQASWLFACVGLAASWYIVFDSSPDSLPAIAFALVYSALPTALLLRRIRPTPKRPTAA
ncbi:MAG TPA: hypothetical protein VFQ45_17625 [Longimicrobium sp.]|nr:hypothetical protein [Longimicrobium sp.]